jgi:16S rRNA (cytidine1402-2'-O)-methyltransferase
MNRRPGALLLLPTLLGNTAPERALPADTLDLARAHDLPGRERQERARLPEGDRSSATDRQPHRDRDRARPGSEPFDQWLAPAIAGTHDVALLSEAGCPAVADPGAGLVARAHELGLRVRPLVGPSSLLLALMACGMSGQRFRFVGYLPQERQALPRRSATSSGERRRGDPAVHRDALSQRSAAAGAARARPPRHAAGGRRRPHHRRRTGPVDADLRLAGAAAGI